MHLDAQHMQLLIGALAYKQKENKVPRASYEIEERSNSSRSGSAVLLTMQDREVHLRAERGCS